MLEEFKNNYISIQEAKASAAEEAASIGRVIWYLAVNNNHTGLDKGLVGKNYSPSDDFATGKHYK